MESTFIRHEACPRCREAGRDRKGNNLGIWTDHVFCFGCGYKRSTNRREVLRFLDVERPQKVLETSGKEEGTFHSTPIQEAADRWLKGFDITDEEIERERFYWDESKEHLVFPIYDDYGNLLFQQSRNFSGRGPKYLTKGNVNGVYRIFGLGQCGVSVGNNITGNLLSGNALYQTEIVLVEDIISAIKVGRQAVCMPLFGSNIPLERLKTLSERFSELGIWLDKDKAEYSLKSRSKASLYFNKVRSIITDKDPKQYTDEEIKEILNES